MKWQGTNAECSSFTSVIYYSYLVRRFNGLFLERIFLSIPLRIFYRQISYFFLLFKNYQQAVKMSFLRAKKKFNICLLHLHTRSTVSFHCVKATRIVCNYRRGYPRQIFLNNLSSGFCEMSRKLIELPLLIVSRLIFIPIFLYLIKFEIESKVGIWIFIY